MGPTHPFVSNSDKITVRKGSVEERLKNLETGECSLGCGAGGPKSLSSRLRIKLLTIFTFMSLKLLRHHKNNQNATRRPEH